MLWIFNPMQTDLPYNFTLGEVIEGLRREGKTTAEIDSLLGLGTYPIWDESHRTELNKLIKGRYYNYKLAFETLALQKMKMENFMETNMPFFNELYLTKAVELNPLYDYNFEETYEGEGWNTENTKGKEDSTNTKTNKWKESGTDSFDTENRGQKDTTNNRTNTGTQTHTDSGQDEITHSWNNKSETNTKTISGGYTDDSSNDRGYEGGYTDTSSNEGEDHVTTEKMNTEYLGNYSMPQDGVGSVGPTGNSTSVWGDDYITTGRKTSEGGNDKSDGTNKSSGSNERVYNNHHIRDNGTTTRTYSNYEEESIIVRPDNFDTTDYGKETKRTDNLQQSDVNQDITSGEEHSNKSFNHSGGNEGSDIGNVTNSKDVEGHKTNEYRRILKGYKGKSPYDLIMKWRDAIINIDKMIVDDCSEMFGCVW